MSAERDVITIDREAAGYPDPVKIADAVERGHEHCSRSACCYRIVADQIRAHVPKPADSKPAEPIGWLAAVEDRDGNSWAIVGGPTDGDRRWYSPDLNVTRRYDDIAAVRTLFKGVQP